MRSFLVSRVWLVTQSSALLCRRKHRQGRWRCRVPACGLAGLQMAEPLGGCGPAHLYESLVGVVFRRQDRDRRVVPIHASESDDAAGYLYHPLSDKIKSGSCDPSRLTNSCENLVSCLKRV